MRRARHGVPTLAVVSSDRMAQLLTNVIDFNARRQERLRRNAGRPQSGSMVPVIVPAVVMVPMMVPLVWAGGWVFTTQLVPLPAREVDR